MNQKNFTRNIEQAYREMTRKWRAGDSKTAQDYLKSGAEAFYKNDFRQAQNHVEEVLKKEQELSAAQIFLAMTLNSLNQLEDATDLCERALKIPLLMRRPVHGSGAAPSFENLESAYREMWRKYCAA